MIRITEKLIREIKRTNMDLNIFCSVDLEDPVSKVKKNVVWLVLFKDVFG